MPKLLQFLSIPQGARASISGPERRMFRMAPRWRSGGFDLTVAYPTGGYLESQFRARGIATVPYTWISPWAPINLLRLVKRIRPDIMHVNGPIPLDLMASLAGRATGCPVVVSRAIPVGDLINHSAARRLLYHGLDRATAAAATRFTAISQTGRQAMIAELPTIAPKTTCIYNGVPLEGISDASSERKAASAHKKPTIGMIAQLADTKGWDVFLKVVAGVNAALEGNVRALVVGDGPLWDELHRMSTSLGLESVVEFTGLLEEIGAQLREIDIFLFPSRREGLSVAILEAMASGLPVVATDVGATAEQVHDGANGYLCPVGDVKGLTKAVLTLAKSPRQRFHMGRRSRQIAEERFSEEAMFDGYQRLFASLVNVGPAAPS